MGTCIACGREYDLKSAARDRGRLYCSCGQPLDPELPHITLPNKHITNAEARHFLEELANAGIATEKIALRIEMSKVGYPMGAFAGKHKARDLNSDLARFLTHFSTFFHEGFPILNYWSEISRQHFKTEKTDEESRLSGHAALWIFRNHLHFAWDAADLHTREWRCFGLRRYADSFSRDPRIAIGVRGRTVEDEPPSHFSPIDQALLFFIRNARTARHCSNPDCVAPYFFASRPKQKQCSTACSGWAKREYKRRWWKQHGKQWRKESQRKATHYRKGRGRKKKSKA